jgi:hypothetical protein
MELAVISSHAPQYVARDREIAARMTKPADGVNSATNLLEDAACLGHTAD